MMQEYYEIIGNNFGDYYVSADSKYNLLVKFEFVDKG